jgi:hypothetical protein
MAFHLITTKGNYTWYVQKGKPKFHDVDAKETIVVLLQADGHELELVLSRFKNIPHSFGICTWRGEMAQFIYDNL